MSANNDSRVSAVLDAFAAQPSGLTWLDMAQVAVDAIDADYAEHRLLRPDPDPLTVPTAGMRRWHRAYCGWYDNDRVGNRIRAAAWGWIADRIVRWA